MLNVQDIISLIEPRSHDDEALITRAYSFSEQAHSGQKRFSGEPYFTHVSETAKILAEYGMTAKTVSAGLLHDTLEDTEVTREEMEKEFGPEILFLVEGVTKLGKLKYHGADRHNESLRKLFVAMSQDIRVLMIKFADRLHNMRTLKYVRVEKQKRIAGETLEIYAPIAYRLGIRKLSRELEDLAFPFVYPEEYSKLKNEFKKQYNDNVESVEKFLKSVKKALAGEKLTDVKTEYRVKGLWSLYRKMLTNKLQIEEIYDVLAIRIITKTNDECYRILGIIHGTWRPVPGKIKDYVAFPKPNGYQGLHTTIFTGDGNIVEVQIRTEEMHHNCEYGIASHIGYKTGSKKGGIKQSIEWVEHLLPKHSIYKKINENEKVSSDIPKWIKDLVDHHKTESNHEDFREGLRSDFFSRRIFVFTPEGDVIDLPQGSSPIDFAYSIHSDIANHAFGVKVNGKMVSLEYELNSGDIVEVLTRTSSKPSPKWLEYAKTAVAKRHINTALKKQKGKN